MVADFALVALPGAYQSSVGALTDSFLLARDRVEHVFSGPDRVRMETRLRILSLDGAPVVMSDGRPLAADGAMDDENPLAFIWLPAFRAGGREAMEQRLAQAKPLLGWLRRRMEEGAIIGASGAASVLLMAGGFTGDIAVPVARALQPLARILFPRQRFEERSALVDHGNLLIANGISHDLQLIIRVVERTLSPDIVRWLCSIMGQDYEGENLLAPDPLVARAQLWIEQRFTGPINMAELAQHLSTSPATLNRHFHKALNLSPKAYVSQLRFQAATRMLEKSTRSIDSIAQLLGYSDSRLFRAMFRQTAGVTASQWRAAHCGMPVEKEGTA
ncbi:GlxA family transcriptional regulator [Sphingobium sp.]|uniref:GlxA family transcriptional regulator n=1 Tax=Sphingobium sp. TaxID=1912891 RepID=UPI0028BEF870|nr:helix-turn-helix domain-containing protein [Sphingobium sp.]